MRLIGCFGHLRAAGSHPGGQRAQERGRTHQIGAQITQFVLILLLPFASTYPAAAATVNATAAEALMVDSGCNKCHAVAKKKDGPAYRDVAAKFKGTPDAEAKVTHHVTSGEMVKFDDGHEEKHKTVKSKNPDEVKNLVNWILSLEGGKKY